MRPSFLFDSLINNTFLSSLINFRKLINLFFFNSLVITSVAHNLLDYQRVLSFFYYCYSQSHYFLPFFPRFPSHLLPIIYCSQLPFLSFFQYRHKTRISFLFPLHFFTPSKSFSHNLLLYRIFKTFLPFLIAFKKPVFSSLSFSSQFYIQPSTSIAHILLDHQIIKSSLSFHDIYKTRISLPFSYLFLTHRTVGCSVGRSVFSRVPDLSVRQEQRNFNTRSEGPKRQLKKSQRDPQKSYRYRILKPSLRARQPIAGSLFSQPVRGQVKSLVTHAERLPSIQSLGQSVSLLICQI